MQLGEVRGYCQRRSWQIEGEYVDAGICGAKERRPTTLGLNSKGRDETRPSWRSV